MSNDPSTPSGSPGDDGLPPEIARIFRDLNGGRDLPPQVVEQLKAMGIADADPGQVAAMTSQIKSMFTPGAMTKGVDVTPTPDGEAVEEMARRYGRLCGIWDKARAGANGK